MPATFPATIALCYPKTRRLNPELVTIFGVVSGLVAVITLRLYL